MEGTAPAKVTGTAGPPKESKKLAQGFCTWDELNNQAVVYFLSWTPDDEDREKILSVGSPYQTQSEEPYVQISIGFALDADEKPTKVERYSTTFVRYATGQPVFSRTRPAKGLPTGLQVSGTPSTGLRGKAVSSGDVSGVKYSWDLAFECPAFDIAD